MNIKSSKKHKLIVAVTIGLLVSLIMPMIINSTFFSTNPEDSPFGQYGLMPPPVSAVDFGSPLNTTGIGLFAYYYRTEGFTLNNTVAAWQNYTDYGSYYDGYVRVDQEASGDTYVSGGSYYIDIHCRVRADGWILAWMTSDQERGNMLYWGFDVVWTCSSYPTANATSPMRAMERIYYVANLTFVGYTNIMMYDYEYSSATKMVVFGNTVNGPGSYSNTVETAYCSIPSSVNTAIVMAWSTYCVDSQSSSGASITVQSTQIVSIGTSDTAGWLSNDTSSYMALDQAMTFATSAGYRAAIVHAVIIYLS